MKIFILLFSLLLLMNNIYAQQSFNASGNNSLAVQVKNNTLSVNQWKSQKISVDIEIKVNYPKEVVDRLVAAKRYVIKSSAANGTFTLSAPDMEKPVTVGGNALTENVNIIVKTPPLYTSKGNTIAKDPSLKSITVPVEVFVKFVYSDAQQKESSTKMGAAPDPKKKSSNTSGDVQMRYGDIIMGGMPLDDFND
jgi:hypothetical protein